MRSSKPALAPSSSASAYATPSLRPSTAIPVVCYAAALSHQISASYNASQNVPEPRNHAIHLTSARYGIRAKENIKFHPLSACVVHYCDKATVDCKRGNTQDFPTCDVLILSLLAILFAIKCSHRPIPSDLRSAGDVTIAKFKSESSSLRKPPRPPVPLLVDIGALPTESNVRCFMSCRVLLRI